jgi:hypothetical protein
MIDYKHELHEQKRGYKQACLTSLDTQNGFVQDRETLEHLLFQECGTKLNLMRRSPQQMYAVWSRLRRAQTRRALLAKTIKD